MDTSKINNSTEHIFDGDIAMASKIVDFKKEIRFQEHYLLSDDSATLHVNCFSSEEEEQTKVWEIMHHYLKRLRGKINYEKWSGVCKIFFDLYFHNAFSAYLSERTLCEMRIKNKTLETFTKNFFRCATAWSGIWRELEELPKLIIPRIPTLILNRLKRLELKKILSY